MATFSSDKLSYIAKPSESIGNNFDITFKMKTKQGTALLMYAGHSEQVITLTASGQEILQHSTKMITF